MEEIGALGPRSDPATRGRRPDVSMKQKNEMRPLVVEILPSLARELQQLLTERGELHLATRVPSLIIVDRCRCGEDFCATFYTQPKPVGAYGPGHRNVALTPNEGMLILDVVADEIACVEVLDRRDVRQKLLAILP